MKRIFTFLFCTVLAFNLSAQDGLRFEINAPSGISGAIEVGAPADDFGGNLTFGESVTGDLVEVVTDTLGNADGDLPNMACDTVTNNMELTGKIALISRGACFFSDKVYRAQQSGAIAAVICNNVPGDGAFGMAAGGDFGGLATIPSGGISLEDCQTILTAMENGETVNITMFVPAFYDALGLYHYTTPQSQIIDLDISEVSLVNSTGVDATDVAVNLDITDPNGNVENFSVIVPSLLIDSTVTVMFDPYTPVDIGEYTMSFTNSLNPVELQQKFEISEYMFGTDDRDINGDIQPSDAQFADAALKYQTASIVIPSEAGGVATHMSFGLSNAADIYTGDAESDVIRLRVFTGDADGDDANDLQNSFTDLENNVVGFADYILTGQEGAGELLYVELDEPVALDGTQFYYAYMGYDGTLAGEGVAPAFLRSSKVDYSVFSTPLELDALYSGWAGQTIVTRLHLDGFDPSTGAQEIKALDKDQVSLAPNPAQDQIAMNITLNDLAEEIIVRITNVNGQLVESKTINNVQEGTYNFNTSNYAAGTYFMNVYTPEGFRAKVFVVAK